MGSHRVIRFHEVPGCGGQDLQGGRKGREVEPISAAPCTPSHPTPRASPSLPRNYTGAGEKWKQPPAVVSNRHKVWRNI